MSCGRRRAESCLARLLLVGWATPRGAAHVVCHGYPGSYTPQLVVLKPDSRNYASCLNRNERALDEFWFQQLVEILLFITLQEDTTIYYMDLDQ